MVEKIKTKGAPWWDSKSWGEYTVEKHKKLMEQAELNKLKNTVQNEEK